MGIFLRKKANFTENVTAVKSWIRLVPTYYWYKCSAFKHFRQHCVCLCLLHHCIHFKTDFIFNYKISRLVQKLWVSFSFYYCIWMFNSLIPTLKPKSNRPLYSNRWFLHWPLMGGLLHLVQRGGAWAGWGPTQSPHRCTKCNSPPINGQCTNFILFDVAL